MNMNKLKSSLIVLITSLLLLVNIYIFHVRNTPEYQPISYTAANFNIVNSNLEKFINSMPNIPENNIDLTALSAKNILIANLRSSEILAEKNSNDNIAIASLNKLMTLATVLSLSPKNEIITIPEQDYSSIPEYKSGIIAGEEYYRNDLIAGMLIASSNDIAYALALNYGNSLENFSMLMNQTAKDLNLRSSNFINPAGFDVNGQYSNLTDLYTIVRYLWLSPGLQSYAGSSTKTISSINDISNHQKHLIEFKTTNLLLGKEYGVRGLKTGTTDEALECLITIIEKKGQQYVIMVTGSLDRYQDTLDIISKL